MIQLKQEFSKEFVRKFKRHQSIGRFLYNNPWAFRVIQRLAETANSLVNDKLRREKYMKFREVTDRADVTEHGYTDKYGDLRAALNSAMQLAEPGFGPESLGEGYALFESQKKFLSEFIESERPDTLFNFGICFAYVDAFLANKYPDVKFSGIDLTAYNKAFNDIEFGDIPNLEVMHGDFFTTLDGRSLSNGCLWHSRTLTFLPISFAEKLYKKARELGFKYIVGFEQNGLSEETVEPYSYGPEDKSTVYWRDNMYIHNYIGLCEKCGYEVVKAKMFETNHTSPDFRVMQYIARRK